VAIVLGDWGNTRLRLWRIEDGNIAERRKGPGIAQVGDPAGALVSALGNWPEERVILCGMAGARNGLREAPYVPCPAGRSAWLERSVDFALSGRKVTLAAGVSTRDAGGRPDVMRGEETQIFGALALNPRLATGERLFVLPGTHSKWVRVSEGWIGAFRTFITGELFGLLEQSSLLLSGDGTDADEEAGFDAGLERSADGSVAASGLFEARAAQLLDGKSSSWARGVVSGLLIGGEVRAMTPADRVVVIGTATLSARYAAALTRLGVPFDAMNGDDCVVAGLRLLDASA
jgi:2-dehydro-3-deoxygalactonokinase